MNAVMNLRLYKMQGISCLAEDLLVSQEGLCSMELSYFLSQMLIACYFPQNGLNIFVLGISAEVS